MPERDPVPRPRPPRWRPWILPGVALGLAVVAGVVLWGKLRREVWAFYSDGTGLRADVDDQNARPVLWQDPEPHHFEDGDGAPGGMLEAAFSADGTGMVLVHQGDGGTNADLYWSDWDGRVWSQPEPINSINTKAAERSPALSRDGLYLYFASDRKGGPGGHDLYVARWDGSAWNGVNPLPDTVNTAADELDPALSADDARLYFSSDRDAGGAEDIFVSEITMPEAVPAPLEEGPETGKKLGRTKKDAADLARSVDDTTASLAPVPEFGAARPVDDLNSKAADVRAALSSRGDHVFLASDRDRGARSGFKIYLSRVTGGEARPPEEVDLYIKQGDVTDPAVRMEGYDLLFSAGSESTGAGADYRLFRSTTREVVGYTDRSRWEQFKELMRNIAWWIVLALAALIALIYILERWRDMTSLFHKCLAGSAVLHLLALLLAMVLLIANTIEKEEARKVEEVEVSIDALAQEELAMESVPEEATLTDPSANLETEKVESEFGASGFEAPDEIRPVPDAAPSRKESVLVEPQPATSEATAETVPRPTAEASVLNDLTATLLPEIEPPELEERNPSESSPVADPGAGQFEPAQPMAEAEKTEPQMTEDTAVETPPDPTQVTGLQPAEPLVDQPKQPEFVESATTESTPVEPNLPAETPPLESEMLAGLPDSQFVDPNEATFEEVNPANAASGDGPEDPAKEMFDPGQAVSNLATEQSTGGGTETDTAEASPAGAADVAESAVQPGSPAGPAFAPELAKSSSDDGLPSANVMPSLPESSLIDPDAPMLEEPGAQAAGDPAEVTKDQFHPGSAASELATAQVPGRAAEDSAVPSEGDASAIPAGGMTSTSAVAEARPSDAATSAPPGVATPNLNPSALPEAGFIDPGVPRLEEPGDGSAGAPADVAKDLFEAGTAVPNLATTQAGGGAVGDAAIDRPVDGGAITAAAHDTSGAAPVPRSDLMATGALPDLGGGAVPADLTAPGLLPAPPLPAELEVPPGLGPRGMADLIKKQRGKPGIDTIEQMGGSKGSEESVGAAMEWLSKNQEADGRWDTVKHGAKQNFDTGGTGLALLCFYGWGERHDVECKYRKNLENALDWLVAQQREDGYLGGGPSMMYSHAIGTIALCEAYGITRDRMLKEPAERAIAYTLAAQHPTLGGWRYTPGNGADTSVTGWQYMALHSARMAGLDVPDQAFEKTRGFLTKMGGGKHGGLYGYQNRGDVSRAMVATGMFCRQLDLVPPSDPMMLESVRVLKMHPMKTANPDLYYVYYATLALYQHQGPVWTAWNERLQEILPLIQKKAGVAAGSWDPSSSMTADGGRVVSTTLATLSLEVYYRLLPMYGFRNTEAEVPEKKVRGE